MKFPIISLSLFLAAGCAVPFPYAQAAEGAPPATNAVAPAAGAEPTLARRLTLSDVLVQAAEQSLEVRVARERTREAQGGMMVSRAKLLPTLNGVAKQTRQDRSVATYGLPETGQVGVPDPVGFDLDYPGVSDSLIRRFDLPTQGIVNFQEPLNLDFDLSDRTGPYNFFDAHLALLVPLIDFENLDAYRGVRTALDAAALNERAATEKVLNEATLLYYGILVTEQAIRASEEKVKLHENRLSTLRDLASAGQSTSLDVRKEEVALASARNDLFSTQLQHTTSHRNLKRLLRIPEEEPLEVDGETSFQPVETPEPAAALDQAFSRRPDWLAQKDNEKAARFARDSARSAYYPTLTAIGSYGPQGLTPDDTIEAWQVGVGLQIPIWDSFSRKGTLLRRASQLAQVEYQGEDLKDQISTDVLSLIDELVYRAQSVQVSQAAYEVAEAAVQLEEDKKAAGTGKPLDLQDAEVDRAQADFHRIEAKYNYSTTAARWFYALGDAAAILTLPAPIEVEGDLAAPAP